MTIISITYIVEGQLVNNEDFIRTKCGEIINIHSKRIVKKTTLGNIKGYYLGGKFIPSDQIKTQEFKVEKK